MKKHKWLITTAIVLIGLSVILHWIHYLMFQDFHHLFIYLWGDIAFVPLEVFLVVIVIEKILEKQEHRKTIEKMNMLVGTFFSEVGTNLLGDLTSGMTNGDEVAPEIAVNAKWNAQRYKKAQKFAESFGYSFDASKIDLAVLLDTLTAKRDFLVLLLANPNLLEHDRFTDLLWAITHLQEELAARGDLSDRPQTDLDHIAGDIKRVYAALTTEWLHYCSHLQTSYPYIFSILVRTHPLQAQPDATVA